MKKTTVLTIILALIWCMIIVLATLSPLAQTGGTSNQFGDMGMWADIGLILVLFQRRKVKDFFIKFTKKSHSADFFTEQTLDFVLHRFFCGLAEMHTDDIGCLADLLSDSRASGGVGCGIVHSKSSCK